MAVVINWISDNIATVVVGSALIVAVIGAIVYMYKNKTLSHQCGNCNGCALAGTCHKKKQGEIK